MITMNAYVGTENAAPDSRTPRKFTVASKMMERLHSNTVCDVSAGYADVMAATPLEIETATVRM
jgi:hypothetical protein